MDNEEAVALMRAEQSKARARADLSRARALIDDAKAEGREPTKDELKAIDDALDKAEQADLGQWATGYRKGILMPQGKRTSNPFLPSDDHYAEDFEVYLKTGAVSDHMVKAQSEGSSASGGYLVPYSFYDQMLNQISDSAPVLKLATVIPTTKLSTVVPSVASHGTAAWTTEGTAYYESDETFGSDSITAYKATRAVKITEELIADSAIPMEEYLRGEFARSIGALVNTNLTVGTASGEPAGIVPGVSNGQTITGATGQTVTIGADDLVNVFHQVHPNARANSRWMMNDTTVAVVRKLKNADGDYLWQQGLAAGQPSTLLGKEVVENPDMPTPAATAKSIFFGDVGSLFVALNQDVRILRNDQRYGPEHVYFTVSMRLGSKVLGPADSMAIWKHSTT